MVTTFERGQYLKTWFDEGPGFGAKPVYYRVVKVCPKMIFLMWEHGERPFRMTIEKAQAYFDAVESQDWRPKIWIPE